MCGLAGILTSRGDRDVPAILQRMLRAIDHRGPDDRGGESIALPAGYRLGLAHSRLAILDCSQAGHQPMRDEASGSWLIFNGEVYNHLDLRKQLDAYPFRSTSDTETVLAGW